MTPNIGGEEACATVGGQLASVHSGCQNDYLARIAWKELLLAETPVEKLRELPVYVVLGCSTDRDQIWQWQDKSDFDYSNWAENADVFANFGRVPCFLQVNAQMAGAPWDDKYRLFYGKWYKRGVTTDREDVSPRAAICQLVVEP